MARCKTCGKEEQAADTIRIDRCQCRVKTRSVPVGAVVTAEEAKATPLDIGGLISLATAVKLAHWNADTKSTEHGALGELYEALEAATDRFVEAYLGKRKGGVEANAVKISDDLCHWGTEAVIVLRGKLTAGEDEDLLNILAELDEALNKARYILKAKGDDMNEPGKVTAAGTSEGAKKGWEHRVHKWSGGDGQEHKVAFGPNDSKDETKAYHAAQKAIIKHGHNNYTESIPVQDHADILEQHGFSGSALDGIYTGREGHADQQVGPNTFHHMSWYKMPSGRYETTAYLSHGKSLGGEWKHQGAETVAATDATPTDSSCSVIHCKDEAFAVKAKKVWSVGQAAEFQWMPGGTRTITASYGRGKQNVPIELCVHCDAEAAKAVQSSFEAIKGANPRRPPYGCIEHRAEERAFEPLKFSWKDDPEPAIYCECEPSELGARNVNGKIHTSFSPTFDTDAEYSKLECSGCGSGLGKCGCGEAHVFRFKTGARGSAANPARVTRLDAQSVGSLTNWPAFKDILPVAASEPQGVVKPGDNKPVDMLSSLKARMDSADAAVEAIKARRTVEERIVDEGRNRI